MLFEGLRYKLTDHLNSERGKEGKNTKGITGRNK
jgi:hypothetical protein